MVDKLSADQREVGKHNYYSAIGSYYDVNRRDFLRGIVAGGVATGAGLGAAYFGYGKVDKPVRIAVIGTGDEGNVLIGGCNPDYVEVKAICDIRPFGQHRAFHGDWSSPSALGRRPGLISVAGYKDEAEARRNVKVYDGSNGGIMACLDDPDIEAVIIALPLFLHAPVAAQAMKRGLHVLTEKLMAHNVAQCKVMSRMAAELTDPAGNPLHLATGHQRHYNVKYDNAINLIKWGLLGQLHHIRAQWHRDNVPGADSWKMPIPGGEKMANGKMYNKILGDIKNRQRKFEETSDPDERNRLLQEIAMFKAWDADKDVDPSKHGYKDFSLGDDVFTAMEELHRWRLFDRTGAGLMAELGSHQLDAVSIFLSSLRDDGKKVHPLSVHAVGGRHIMPKDRSVGDHVYCMYEFPGPEYDPTFGVGYYDRVANYPKSEFKNGAWQQVEPVPGYDVDPNKKVVVTYSSINGNGFGGWGEVVMGTKGTLVLDKETDVLLYRNSDTSSKVGVAKQAGGYALDTSASGDLTAPVAQAADSGPVSRGYREEIEHWAYCIRNPDKENRPRCYPEVAMGDAVIALGTNVALKNAAEGKSGYLEFDEAWFDIDNDAVPDGSDIAAETEFMKQPVA
ncbi:Gfo/Idh/MocA family oxidoreductase [Rubripirellula amarantea]|uniref:Glucose--fructose oxidoreductase n=1 Tax=Rubripirellula amarantea TaxID=2527999 RepID=A0A5C5WKU9_9BACT|nr:Gfo/Idh/MocA family oxidoreductase [Rubripirellula amarantea]MDA8746312.1 Gfo/Idh/MocA family oxidoreductase [Rubripirellula amarantea]TWT50729.1 Glucose--fructose oxidoreductase precursor [Rubripirellula amarantea]